MFFPPSSCPLGLVVKAPDVDIRWDLLCRIWGQGPVVGRWQAVRVPRVFFLSFLDIIIFLGLEQANESTKLLKLPWGWWPHSLAQDSQPFLTQPYPTGPLFYPPPPPPLPSPGRPTNPAFLRLHEPLYSKLTSPPIPQTPSSCSGRPPSLQAPGGVLSLEKGTDCGPTAGERWLSRPATAKKGGLSSYHIVG